MEAVCFFDESGNPSACTTMCGGVVCFERVSGSPALRAGIEAWSVVRSVVGWRRGELRFRGVARAAARRGIGVEALVYAIALRSLWAGGCCLHVSEPHSVREQLLYLSLAKALEALGGVGVGVVIDEQALPPARLGRVRRALRTGG